MANAVSNVSAVMKVDDDVLVDPAKLGGFVERKIDFEEASIACRVNQDTEVERNQSSKWYSLNARRLFSLCHKKKEGKFDFQVRFSL